MEHLAPWVIVNLPVDHRAPPMVAHLHVEPLHVEPLEQHMVAGPEWSVDRSASARSFAERYQVSLLVAFLDLFVAEFLAYIVG